MSDWRRALLKALGMPITSANLQFLATWQRYEGGATNNSASYNWLNTTHGPGRSINSDGVKAFPDFQTGIRSLAETLHNGNYHDILRALAHGDPYHVKPIAGLETWVSGSPTGNPHYAAQILGTHVGGGTPSHQSAPGLGATAPTMAVPAAPLAGPPGFDPHGDIASVLFGDDPKFASMIEQLRLQQPHIIAANQLPVRPSRGVSLKGGPGIAIPLHWSGTHVTDGLGWGTKTAHDFMGAPGTPVRLSEDVTVVYYHPEGAQGGGSMLLRTKSGRTYWVGHIASPHKAGDHIRRGRPIAVIANQHVSAPHVHVDARGGR